jgi:hypothetical protein
VSFSADLGAFATKASASVDRTRRAVALKLFGSIIRDTPVLTGRLRGNWQCSVESPLLGTIPERGGNTPNIFPAVQRGEVMSAVAQVKGTDKTLYLRNNLPYAARIEFDGWSHTKAPAGMMRKNVARFTRLVSEETRGGKL